MMLYGLVALYAVVAPVTLQEPITFSSEERSQGEAEVRTAAEYFARVMRDPGSATFRNVFIGKRPKPTATSKVIVCGEVNGRNAFGGYVGFDTFIVSGTDVHVGTAAGLEVSRLCSTDRVFDTRDYSPELRSAFSSASK